MPARNHRLMSGPYGLENFAPSSAVAMVAFSSRVAVARLVKSCALSAASAWAKCTT